MEWKSSNGSVQKGIKVKSVGHISTCGGPQEYVRIDWQSG